MEGLATPAGRTTAGSLASGPGYIASRTPGLPGALAKRPLSEVAVDEATPLPKRSALAVAPPSAAGAAGDEVGRLQAQVYSLRQRCDDLQADSQHADSKHALDLLREKHKCEEIEQQRDFLMRTEERLKTQLAEARQHAEEERTARLDERRFAHERQETACDELREAAARDQLADRESIRALQAEVASLSAAGCAAGDAGGAGGGAVGAAAAGAVEAASRRLSIVTAERDALESKVATLERKMSTADDTAALFAAAQKEITLLKQHHHHHLSLHQQAGVAPPSTPSVPVGGEYGLAADMGELRRQLAAAEAERATHALIAETHKALEAQVLEWGVLFAAEASTELTLSSDGLPPASAAASTKALLTTLRSENARMVSELGRLQGSMRDAEASAAAADKARAHAEADGVKAAAEAASAAEAAQRAEWRTAELQVKIESTNEYLKLLEDDREKRRDPSAAASSGGGEGEGEREGARPGEVAALMKQIKANEERCVQLTKQASEAGARASEAAGALRLAKLDAASARQSAATATALQRQLSNQTASVIAPIASGGADGGGDDAADAGGLAGTKVLHMVHNPASNAQQATVDGLKSRVRALKMQLDVAEAVCSTPLQAPCSRGPPTPAFHPCSTAAGRALASNLPRVLASRDDRARVLWRRRRARAVRGQVRR